ncbi:MAG: hypothetical protein HUJ51_01255 [Eggerthellaceae bacterium]|nr:hypothetical protein [Eggerthellaceae bacterium]
MIGGCCYSQIALGASRFCHVYRLYHAGLEKQEHKYIEQLFYTGTFVTLIATSAFGEGIDIPDIRNVVLFHMSFSETEFK